MEYTVDQREVLVAGLQAREKRDRLWVHRIATLQGLRKLGLVEFIEKRGANGRPLLSLPDGLTLQGVQVARELREPDHS
jgi:hypothetical protein